MRRIVLLLYFLAQTASFQPLGIHLLLPIKSRPLSSRLFATPDPVPKRELEQSPPPYKALDKALVVFSNPYFYDDADDAIRYRERRENVLGNLTVGEVYVKFVLENKQDVQLALVRLANSIRALEDALIKYYAPARIPPEQVLAGERIDLSDGSDCGQFDQREIQGIPVLEKIWSESYYYNRNQTSRGLPLGLVLGPSGSGKTFFSLQYLAYKFLNKTMPKNRATIYLTPSPSGVKFNEQTNSTAATHLFKWIKMKLTEEKQVLFDGPLRMHVCLIIDEAGAEDVRWWFEDKAMLTALCKEARKLAESVAVVVSGTGLTGRDLSSKDDAYFFRMKRWEIPDLEKLLGKEESKLYLEANETTETVAKAVFAHPELGALATNGRAAYFLSEAIQEMTVLYARVSWPYQLDEWAPTIVSQVFRGYTASNGIQKLDRRQRYRVAASVFRALNSLKAGEAKLPIFEGIKQGVETSVAASLLQYNLEIDDTMQIVKGERFAFTVTPAIALVLYAMAGISTSLTPGWRSEENLAALYASRQWILECMEPFLLTANVQNKDNNAFDALDQSLGRLRLVLLRAQVQPAKEVISVPMVGVGTIVVNGERAKFADVIAPYCLIQAKRATFHPAVDFGLLEELAKCSLAVSLGGKKDKDDTRLLQGLVAMWQGHLDPVAFVAKDDYPNPKEDLDQQISRAFPANLLCVDTQRDYDKIRYALIDGIDATEITIDNGTKIPLPTLEGTTLTFLVSTNAKIINLKLSSEIKLKITEANVDNDLSLDTTTLSEPQRLDWERFLKDHVREEVTIRFLFTRSIRPKE